MAEIVPAILTNDLSDFRKKYAELFAMSDQFTKLHIDFADEFVNNQTLMPKDLQFLSAAPFVLMAHFMTYNPAQYFADAKAAGFKWGLFHYEVFEQDQEIHQTIEQAKTLGLQVGLVLNPGTPLFHASKFFDLVNTVQLMGIVPGAQGREFKPETIGRILELKKLKKDVIISVDGGVHAGVARQCMEAGADLLVSGSAIWKSNNPKQVLEDLNREIKP